MNFMSFIIIGMCMILLALLSMVITHARCKLGSSLYLFSSHDFIPTAFIFKTPRPSLTPVNDHNDWKDDNRFNILKVSRGNHDCHINILRTTKRRIGDGTLHVIQLIILMVVLKNEEMESSYDGNHHVDDCGKYFDSPFVM